ncbi:Ankyrin repeat protein [Pandoravirus kuranda]|uniref:Ankyrin repeat protein n=1 Tax=Pandoravirus kuranda TaxID=3019033 RepID=A0AA95EDW2_9VIRU|nr:Ankyrin repeat protein [Pandoravirus kuranda]
MAAPLCLDDLPDELLVSISAALGRPADVARWRACSRRLYDAHAFENTVDAYLREDKRRCRRLLESSAPLAIIRGVFCRWGETPLPEHFDYAAAGGRVDVVRWFVHAIPKAAQGVPPHPLVSWDAATLKAAARSAFYRTSSHGRHDLLRFLHGLFGTEEQDAQLGHSAVRWSGRDAALRGDLATVALTHDMLTGAPARPPKCLAHRTDCVCASEHEQRAIAPSCGCSPDTALWAIEDDHMRIAEWMHEAGCSAAYPRHAVCAKALCHAIVHCTTEAFWYLAAAQPPPSPEAFARAIDVAARKGHVGIVARLCREGLATCRKETLIAAAEADHVALLQWAAGEPHIPGWPEASSDEARPPLDAWRPTLLAWHAARRGSFKVVEWLLSRPDTRRCVTIASIEAALSRGHIDVALAAHEKGIVRFEQWSALDAAVVSNDVGVVQATADRGAVCTVTTFVAAIVRASGPRGIDLFTYLCRRYGVSLVQDAVDRIAPTLFTPSVAALVRAHAPGVRLPDDPV